jgi:hypothetical protein
MSSNNSFVSASNGALSSSASSASAEKVSSSLIIGNIELMFHLSERCRLLWHDTEKYHIDTDTIFNIKGDKIPVLDLISAEDISYINRKNSRDEMENGFARGRMFLTLFTRKIIPSNPKDVVHFICSYFARRNSIDLAYLYSIAKSATEICLIGTSKMEQYLESQCDAFIKFLGEMVAIFNGDCPYKYGKEREYKRLISSIKEHLNEEIPMSEVFCRSAKELMETPLEKINGLFSSTTIEVKPGVYRDISTPTYIATRHFSCMTEYLVVVHLFNALKECGEDKFDFEEFAQELYFRNSKKTEEFRTYNARMFEIYQDISAEHFRKYFGPTKYFEKHNISKPDC